MFCLSGEPGDAGLGHLLYLSLLDEVDAHTLKHHADDLIGVGRKALDTLAARTVKRSQ